MRNHTFAGLNQYDAVDETLHMYQYNPPETSGQPLRYNNAAAQFNLTAQTTNLARVTLTGIVERVSRCRSGSESPQIGFTALIACSSSCQVAYHASLYDLCGAPSYSSPGSIHLAPRRRSCC